MRLPYLQVAEETWTQARELAGLLSIHRHTAHGLLLDLWAWGVDLGPKDGPPTGLLASPHAVLRMAAALEWTADASDLAAALYEVGAIVFDDMHVRVRGIDRYAAAWRKREADRERAASGRRSKSILHEVAARRSDIAATSRRVARESPRETETETYTEKEETEALAGEAPASAAPPEKPDPPATSPAATAFQAAWNATADAALPRCREMTRPRARAVKASGLSLEEWQAVIALVNASDFLCGRKPGKDWRAPIDWVLKPANLTKIREGVFDDARPATAPPRERNACAACGLLGDDTHYVAVSWGQPLCVGCSGEADGVEGNAAMAAWVASRREGVNGAAA